MRSKIIGIMLAFTLLGCDDCKPNTFRCNGAVLEMCSSGGDWVYHTDCAEVYMAGSESLTCCYSADGGVDEPDCWLPSECDSE